MRIAKRMIFFIWVTAFFFVSIAALADPYSRLINKGNRYYRNELFGEALRHYLEGKDKNPKALEPIFNTGDAYYKREDYSSSIESFNASLGLSKKESKRRNKLSLQHKPPPFLFGGRRI